MCLTGEGRRRDENSVDQRGRVGDEEERKGLGLKVVARQRMQQRGAPSGDSRK